MEKTERRILQDGKNNARLIMKRTATTRDYKDCTRLPGICDTIDDSVANFWNGYIENSIRRLKKKLSPAR